MSTEDLEYQEGKCPIYNERSVPESCGDCPYFEMEWHEGVLCRFRDDRCSICGRGNVPIERHHLNPDEREGLGAPLCRPCHKQVHAAFTNHELKQEFRTPKKIKNADRMQDFIGWIEGTDKENVKIRESRRVRKWKS